MDSITIRVRLRREKHGGLETSDRVHLKQVEADAGTCSALSPDKRSNRCHEKPKQKGLRPHRRHSHARHDPRQECLAFERTRGAEPGMNMKLDVEKA